MTAMFRIRKVDPRDAEAFWALRLRALREHPNAFAASPDEDEKVGLDEVRERLAAADGVVVGAFSIASLEGMAGVLRERRIKQSHRAHLWGVYVADEARGQGIGRRLLEAAIEGAREQLKVERLLLSVADEATSARQLYESVGFRAYAKDERALRVAGRYVDEVLMVLDLS
jgi:ribosomal protein S18 acetylase RimI-like enzyme